MSKKEKIFPLNTIGGRIQSLRHKAGYLGKKGRIGFYSLLCGEPGECSDQDGISRNVYNWESGANEVSLDTLKRICEKCNCSADYLLGIEKEVNHDLHFICNYTGLSEDAVNALHMLHTPPIDPSCVDFQQKGRYDVIALNIILEDFYNNAENKKNYQKFSRSTDTPLNQIGRYIGLHSLKLDIDTPVFRQDETTDIFPPEDIKREIIKTRIFELLEQLREKYAFDIAARKKENSEYFDTCFENYIKDSNTVKH